LSIHLLEEMSTPALDALDRDRTVVIVTVSPLEEHGPHLPLGVDAMTARHLAGSIAERIVAERPGWSAVLAPTLHLGSFTFEAPGTISIRQRVLRDVVVDYGRALARSGFRYVLIANGHAGAGHLVALEEAASIVSRRHRITMASLTGHLAWEFLRGRMLSRIEAALGGALSADERLAFAEDAHGGWWETSVMLMLRPDLVDPSYRSLEPAR
jgi:creatinine amidohydrolase